MAASVKTQTSVVFFLLFIFSSVWLSSSRLLNDNPSATQPILKLALPVADQDPKSIALPCDHMVPFNNFRVGVLRSPTQKLDGPMFLSMLPKGGQVPSSGPSKGSNDIKT